MKKIEIDVSPIKERLEKAICLLSEITDKANELKGMGFKLNITIQL